MDANLIGLVAGLATFVLGTGLLLFSLLRRKRVVVQANSGIAIGGSVDSSTVINQSSSSASPAKHHGHGLTIVAIVVELIGIAVTLWHAYHMASLA